jgi:hypothetical protein
MKWSFTMSPELELLDQLGGGEMSYLLMERHVFEGDRRRALHCIEKMRADGLIELAIGRRQVEGWRLAAWRRSPTDPATASALEQAELSLTDRGADWLMHGR